jgi:hypothetical protein
VKQTTGMRSVMRTPVWVDEATIAVLLSRSDS